MGAAVWLSQQERIRFSCWKSSPPLSLPKSILAEEHLPFTAGISFITYVSLVCSNLSVHVCFCCAYMVVITQLLCTPQLRFLKSKTETQAAEGQPLGCLPRVPEKQDQWTKNWKYRNLPALGAESPFPCTIDLTRVCSELSPWATFLRALLVRGSWGRAEARVGKGRILSCPSTGEA